MGERNIVMFSGGIGSWAAGKRVAERRGTKNLTLLFTDTLIEDADLYRFLAEGAANIGGELVRIVDGRTPWQVFRDERFLGNSRVDPCSKILKRQLANRWLREHCDPAETICYVGIDWTEEHRFTPLRQRRLADGWRYEAPLCEPPFVLKSQMIEQARSCGLRPSRAYEQGLSHDNCGGGCIKAGQGSFAKLLRVRPDVFATWESGEQEMRDFLGKDVSILTDRSGDGKKKPLTLRALREHIEADGQIDLFDIGGCGRRDGETPSTWRDRGTCSLRCAAKRGATKQVVASQQRWAAEIAAHPPCAVCGGRLSGKSCRRESMRKFMERATCSPACGKIHQASSSSGPRGPHEQTVYRKGELVPVDYAGGFGGRQTLVVRPDPRALPVGIPARSYSSVASAWLL